MIAKKLIVANWKCNPSSQNKAKEIFRKVKIKVKGIRKAEVVICPPFVYLSTLQKLSNNKIALGAQDTFFREGPFTGEVSPMMLRDSGAKYVIIGHSERRQYFRETDEIINKKLKATLKAGLYPILCIGETQEERKTGKTHSLLGEQIEKALKAVPSTRIKDVVIAYEPVWAIGGSRPCDATEAQTIYLLIKKIITTLYNRTAAKQIRILYGGSINSSNSSNFLREANVDGFLIGRASLDAAEFAKIIKNI